MAVFLAILFLILLLLASPVSLSVRLEQEWQVVLRYLFLSFRLWPQKEKKEKAETETEEKEKEKDEKKAGKKALLLDTLKRRSIPGLLNLLSEAASLAVSVLKRFLSHVHVSKFDLCLTIAGADAANVALQYGNACTVVYPAVHALMAACRCSGYGVSVVPDFQKKETEVRFLFRARISLFFIIKEALSALFRFLLFWKRAQQETPQPSPQGIHDTEKGKRG